MLRQAKLTWKKVKKRLGKAKDALDNYPNVGQSFCGFRPTLVVTSKVLGNSLVKLSFGQNTNSTWVFVSSEWTSSQAPARAMITGGVCLRGSFPLVPLSRAIIMAKPTSFRRNPGASSFRTEANRPYWRDADRIRGGASESFRKGATKGKKSGTGRGS